MSKLRHDWTHQEVANLYELPYNDLIFKSHSILRENFDANEITLSVLMSIKTGACPEDCAYCPQSGHYSTGVEKEKLLDKEKVLAAAKVAKDNGAVRFCMGAAWRNLPKKALADIKDIVTDVKAMGMQTCMTLGMLDESQAEQLKAAGLDYYNHNLDTSPEYYKKIITTRTYQERLDTLKNVRNAGMKTCSGGIIGMGETRDDRIGLLLNLANLPEHPKSVPINKLVAIKGTPLENTPEMDPIEFIRTIAVTRIMMPQSYVRLSAGRLSMSDEMQASCFFAGANSLHYGDTLLTSVNNKPDKDRQLLKRLGLTPKQAEVKRTCESVEC